MKPSSIRTRSVTAKEDKSESGYDSRRPRTFEDPLRSPSTVASALPRIPYEAPAAGSDPATPAFATEPPVATATGRVAPTTIEGASAAPAPRLPESRATAIAFEYGESIVAPSTSYYPTTSSTIQNQNTARSTTAARDASIRDTASTIRSRRSYKSDVARVKRAEYEAQKRIAAIRNEQLEIEKALVNKRLEYEVSTIEAEAEAWEEGSVRISEDRVDEA